uniref:Uncharacterized protein n=1 Tax=Oncorhynchus mykiss TaxID=8022 RepID=A0A8C7USB4_ONCMY
MRRCVPFSNTHLRLPRGFGSILEGLVREVIPTFAAFYFPALLKEREGSYIFSGLEWCARLEDRFSNNHAFNVNFLYKYSKSYIVSNIFGKQSKLGQSEHLNIGLVLRA